MRFYYCSSQEIWIEQSKQEIQFTTELIFYFLLLCNYLCKLVYAMTFLQIGKALQF